MPDGDGSCTISIGSGSIASWTPRGDQDMTLGETFDSSTKLKFHFTLSGAEALDANGGVYINLFSRTVTYGHIGLRAIPGTSMGDLQELETNSHMLYEAKVENDGGVWTEDTHYQVSWRAKGVFVKLLYGAMGGADFNGTNNSYITLIVWGDSDNHFYAPHVTSYHKETGKHKWRIMSSYNSAPSNSSTLIDTLPETTWKTTAANASRLLSRIRSNNWWLHYAYNPDVGSSGVQYIGYATQPVDVVLSIIDKWGNLCDPWTGDIYLLAEYEDGSSPNTQATLPESVTPTNGRYHLTGLRVYSDVNTRIKFRVLASDKAFVDGEYDPDSLVCYSNWMDIEAQKPPYELHYGDSHSHTITDHSHYEGTAEIREQFLYMKNTIGCEWLAPGEHDNGSACEDTLCQKWDGAYKDAIEEYYNPGHFVTFIAYEWTHGGQTYPNTTHHCTVILAHNVRHCEFYPNEVETGSSCDSADSETENEVILKYRNVAKRPVLFSKHLHRHHRYSHLDSSECTDDKESWRLLELWNDIGGMTMRYTEDWVDLNDPEVANLTLKSGSVYFIADEDTPADSQSNFNDPPVAFRERVNARGEYNLLKRLADDTAVGSIGAGEWSWSSAMEGGGSGAGTVYFRLSDSSNPNNLDPQDLEIRCWGGRVAWERDIYVGCIGGNDNHNGQAGIIWHRDLDDANEDYPDGKSSLYRTGTTSAGGTTSAVFSSIFGEYEDNQLQGAYVRVADSGHAIDGEIGWISSNDKSSDEVTIYPPFSQALGNGTEIELFKGLSAQGHGALTGVWARGQCTRCTIFNGLYDRRVIATSGLPILAWFEATNAGRAWVPGEQQVVYTPDISSGGAPIQNWDFFVNVAVPYTRSDKWAYNGAGEEWMGLDYVRIWRMRKLYDPAKVGDAFPYTYEWSRVPLGHCSKGTLWSDPIDNIRDWTDTDQGSGESYIVFDEDINQWAMKVYSNGTTNVGYRYCDTDLQAFSTNFTISFEFKVGQMTTDKNFFYFDYTATDRLRAEIRSDGSIYVGSTPTEVGTSLWTADTWHTLTFDVNATADTADVYVDGVLQASGVDIQVTGSYTVGRVAFTQATTSTSGDYTLYKNLRVGTELQDPGHAHPGESSGVTDCDGETFQAGQYIFETTNVTDSVMITDGDEPYNGLFTNRVVYYLEVKCTDEQNNLPTPVRFTNYYYKAHYAVAGPFFVKIETES